MRTANLLPSVLVALGLAAGGLSLTATAASDKVDAALQEAATAIEQARAKDWIWRDTEDFYAQAQEAAKRGEQQRALELANKAREQAELAVKQYHIEHRMNRTP